MSDEGGDIVDSGPIELQATSSMEVSGTVVSGNVTVGDQTLEFAKADIEIKVATAAHEREIERQRVEREIEKDKREQDEAFKDRHHQRIRDNCTYAVVVILIVLGLVGSFYVAATTTDSVRQVWAQGFATTIAGVVGGAFAGFLIGGRK